MESYRTAGCFLTHHHNNGIKTECKHVVMNRRALGVIPKKKKYK